MQSEPHPTRLGLDPRGAASATATAITMAATADNLNCNRLAMIAIAATHTIAWKIIVNLFVALSLLVDHTMIASCQMTRVQYIYISVCVYYIYIKIRHGWLAFRGTNWPRGGPGLPGQLVTLGQEAWNGIRPFCRWF